MALLDVLHQPAWVLAFAPVLVLGVAVLVVAMRRAQVQRDAQSRAELDLARERGSHEARLLHPEIDLSHCIGCGACVHACPEEGVLGLLHGQAVVLHGSRCVGHGQCAAACPTGAIALTLGDLRSRRDLPALNEDFEAVRVPGLFLAGEITGFALIRTAVTQGVAVANAAARHVARRPVDARVAVAVGGHEEAEDDDPVLDALVVGAGPAGLACSLRLKELGLRSLTIDQESRLGGTVAAYPRRKLVMTQPVDLPLHGRLRESTYSKEDLVGLWESVVREQRLSLRTGVKLDGVVREPDGTFLARTSAGPIRARTVCLALGRRGSPRRLGVPGEELAKVAYSLIDAESYRDRKVLVVGGGDSAIEAALGLAEQPGNEVTLSYRRGAFSRLKSRNEARIARAMHEGRVRVLFESHAREITARRVVLQLKDGSTHELPNDDVFIFAGGEAPFALLERAGVSFDPKDRPAPPEAVERGTGLLRALVLAFLGAGVLSAWALWFRSYYGVETIARAASPLHRALRPGGPVGLSFGVGACALFVFNLAYLVRRAPRLGSWMPGTLRAWMGSHVFTGILALLFVLLHAGFSMRPTLGGHSLLALLIVVATGSIGRYLYAFVPRAANGTEANIDDLRAQLASVSADWDREGRGFGALVREHIEHLAQEGRWRPGLLARIGVLVRGQFRLRRGMARLREVGAREGIPDREVRRMLALARRAYRLTLLVTHYEEIRAVLSSWRYFHRWLGLLLVLLGIAHILTAVRYASLSLDWSAPLEEVRR